MVGGCIIIFLILSWDYCRSTTGIFGIYPRRTSVDNSLEDVATCTIETTMLDVCFVCIHIASSAAFANPAASFFPSTFFLDYHHAEATS